MHPTAKFSRLLVAVVAIAALAVSACGGSPTAPQSPLPTHTVTGTVTESTSEGLVPVQGALVTHQASGRSVTTDAAGTYSLSSVPAGMVTIMVSRASFDTAIRLVSLFADTRLDLQLVRHRELPSDHFVTGIVFERVGSVQTPVAGAVIEDSYSHLSVTSGSDGRYRLDFSPADQSRFDGFAGIFVTKEGFEPVNRSVVVFGEVRLDIELIRR